MDMVKCKRPDEASAFIGSANSRKGTKCAELIEVEKKGWYNLEPEVLAIIIKFLDWPERFKLERVCVHWRNVIESKQFLNVGVVMCDDYSKQWPNLSFDKLIYNLAVGRQKIISGIDINTTSMPESVTINQLTAGVRLVRSWDHFKVLRLCGIQVFGDLAVEFDHVMNVVLRQAFNLEELVVKLWVSGSKIEVDLASFQHLKKVDLIDCFPVNYVGDCLTTLSIAGRGACRHDLNSITDVLVKCSGTLRTLKMCKFEVVGPSIPAEEKSFIFPRLESLTIDDVQLGKCDLKIDLTEAKLKHFNYADCPTNTQFEFLVNFDEIQNVLSNAIESFNVKTDSHTIVSIMDQMMGTCYPKLCHLELASVKGEYDENTQDRNNYVLLCLLRLLENAENLNYIRLHCVIRKSEWFIRLLIKMKSLKRAFEVKVETISDRDNESFWRILVEQLEVEKIESNDSDGKIVVHCTFDDNVISVGLIDVLRDKYNIYFDYDDADVAPCRPPQSSHCEVYSDCLSD